MRSSDRCFNFPSMMHPSLRRVIVLLPVLVWGCAHETSEMPDELGAEVTGGGSGGTESEGNGGTKPVTGGTSSAGSTSKGGAGGTSTKPSTGGGGTGTETETGGSGGSASGGKGGTTAGGTAGGGAGGTSPTGGTGAGGKGGSGGTAGTGSMGGTGGAGGTGGSGPTAGTGGTGSGTCDGVAAWSVKAYSAGDRVKNGGKLYECKPYPFTGWCANAAYEPGLADGTWTNAWTLVGGC